MKKLHIFALCGLLCSCTTGFNNVYTYKKINTKQKTIAVSGYALWDIHQDLKQSLRNNGYKIFIKNKSKDDGYVKTSARYELLTDFNLASEILCTDTSTGRGYMYAISVIDLKQGDEVFNITGRSCQADIVKIFNQLITNQYKPEAIEEYAPQESTCTPKYSIGSLNLWCE